MATSSTIWQIQGGTPTIAEDTEILIGIGTAGTPGAARRLTFPTSLLPPLIYWREPDVSYNVDNDVLVHPIALSTLTLTSTRLTKFARREEDIIVTETWNGSETRASMPMSMFRQLYMYAVNVPPFDAGNLKYVTWEPRDRNEFVYNIEILNLSVGGSGDGPDQFQMRTFRSTGGEEIATPLMDDMDVDEDELLAGTVTLTFRVVGKVES